MSVIAPRTRSTGALVLSAALLSACGSSPLIPDKTLNLASTLTVSSGQIAAGIVLAAVVYLVYDPLAPNWEIKEQKLSDDTYRLDMRMKRYHTGGQGEAMQVLRRRAETLQMQGGFKEFQVVEYTEGIESKTFGAHRYAEAKLRLVKG